MTVMFLVAYLVLAYASRGGLLFLYALTGVTWPATSAWRS